MNVFYPVNQSIEVRIVEVNGQTSVSDLTLTPTNPSGSDGTPVTMTHIADGIYKATFTPNIAGRWYIRITSATYPDNNATETIYIGASTSDHKLKVEVYPATGIENVVQIEDGLGSNVKARVDASNRFWVATPPPEAPSGTVSVVKMRYSNVFGISNDIFTIPNGETLLINRFAAGAEEGNKGNVVELWYDPNGNGVGMLIIDTIFCNGTSDQHDLNGEFIGDGIGVIRMRRRRLGGGSRRIFGRWEGYY